MFFSFCFCFWFEFFTSFFCEFVLLSVAVMFIFTICYVFREIRVLRSLFAAFYSSILCLFLLCSVVANAVAYNFFWIVLYFCCLHPQWLLCCSTACYQMCFAACLRFNSVYLHFVCATLRPDIFVAGIRFFLCIAPSNETGANWHFGQYFCLLNSIIYYVLNKY